MAREEKPWIRDLAGRIVVFSRDAAGRPRRRVRLGLLATAAPRIGSEGRLVAPARRRPTVTAAGLGSRSSPGSPRRRQPTACGWRTTSWRTPSRETGYHEPFGLLAAVAARPPGQLGPLVAATSFRSAGLLARWLRRSTSCRWPPRRWASAAAGTSRSTGRSAIPSITGSAGSRKPYASSMRSSAVSAVDVPGLLGHRRGCRAPANAGSADPLLVAADGPRMLRLAARYGDAWQAAWFGVPDAAFHEQHARLATPAPPRTGDPPRRVRGRRGRGRWRGSAPATDAGAIMDALHAGTLQASPTCRSAPGQQPASSAPCWRGSGGTGHRADFEPR